LCSQYILEIFLEKNNKDGRRCRKSRASGVEANNCSIKCITKTGDSVMIDKLTNTNADEALNLEHHHLITVSQFCKIFPWPSEFAMRSYIFKAKELGLSEAFTRVGRRVLICPKIFFKQIKQMENHLQGDSYEATQKPKRQVGL